MTTPRMFQPEVAAEDVQQLMVMVLDIQDAAPPIRRLRDWALDVVAPRPGEVVVDVGSGTGTMTRALGALVAPGGQVVGVEPNLQLRELAVSRATAAAGVSFVDGLAGALPMADASVDLLWCERVLQHVADPQAAVDEFARVLRPGGRAVLLDSDHASRITSTLDPDLETKLSAAFLAQLPNPRSARHIPAQAMQAGLTVEPDIGSTALIFSPQILLATSMLTANADAAVAGGFMTRAEADEAVRVLRAAAEAGHGFAAVTVFGFVLRRPVTDG